MPKQQIKFSIIIPVYNIAKYLPECLESILSQNFKDYEIIAVDDGSSDNSGKILDDYAKKDHRIKVIHQENSGVSVARNNGLEKAQGQYISFVDGDDFVAPQMFCELAEYTEKFPDIDLFIFGTQNFCDGKILPQKGFLDKLIKAQNEPISDKDFLLELSGTVWTKIYKKHFINSHKIRFAKGVPLAEDGLFNLECYCHKPTIKAIAKDYYFYRIFRENSTMSSGYDLDKELLGQEYILKQDFYQNAPKNIRLLMDEKICIGLLFRFSLLPRNKCLENLVYLQKYQNYLEQTYTQEELKNAQGYARLIKQIKTKYNEKISFLQRLFSIKNSKDKRYKVLRLLGLTFRFKRA